MAQTEPMDVDSLASDFDDKENSIQNSNVFKTSADKGYEDLDASEYNMKLRYSLTPANSPMSKSYTSNYRSDSEPNSLNNTVVVDNNLTRSLNLTATKTEVLRSPKLPLQVLPSGQYNCDRRSCDREGDIAVTITGTDNDDNLSLPSTSSSAVQTPEATTPTKEIPKSDGSPIMRGLKSVLNMFRPSHSPVPPFEDGPSHETISHKMVEKDVRDSNCQLDMASKPVCNDFTPVKDGQSNHLLASTPISSSKVKDMTDTSKRNSPLKESVVFNDDLERELQWQEETEVFFKHEKIPIHKLFFQPGQLNVDANINLPVQNNDINNLNTTVEYMDISNADISYKSIKKDEPLNDYDSKVFNNEMSGVESDNEFLDCETTDPQNKSYILKTVQETKTLPVVFQTHNLVHESCVEDYVEPLNMSDINKKDKIPIDKRIISESELVISKEVNEPVSVVGTVISTSKVLSNDLNNLPGCSEIVTPCDSNTPLVDTIKLFKADETANLPFECIDDHINYEYNLNVVEDNPNHAEDISNGNIVDSLVSTNKTNDNKLGSDKLDEVLQQLIQPSNLNLENQVELATYTTNNIQNITELPLPSSLQHSIDDNKTLQIIVETDNLFHESCIDTPSYCKDNEIPTNLPTSSIIMKNEDVINFDTDDTNTTRILFDIDALLLNHAYQNHENAIVSKYADNTLDNINALDISNANTLQTNDNNLQNESGILDDTVVITNNEIIKENVTASNDHFNENTLVFDDNINADDSSLDATNENITEAIEKPEFHDINVDKSSHNKSNVEMNVDNTFSLSTRDKITEMEYGSNDIDNNEDCIVGSIKKHNSFHLKEIDDPQDITMDSLDHHFHQPPCEIKEDINNDIGYRSCENKINCNTISSEYIQSSPMDLQNDALTCVPLPLDVPLPNDDDNEKDKSLDLCSIQQNNENGVMLEIKLENSILTQNHGDSDFKETMDQTMILNTSQVLNKQIQNNLHSNDFNISNDVKTLCDVEMALTSNIIQETPHSQLSTNLTSCLQELNIQSSNKEFQEFPDKTNELLKFNNTLTSSEIVINQELHVDNRLKTPTLPDVVQAVKNTQEAKTNISNETMCFEDNIKSNVIDEEILTSANNSPYVSVTELDLNLTSNIPVEGDYKNIQPDTRVTQSPPISLKCNRKGYNINFDEIDDPFATKTNVRMSPPPEEVSKKSFTPVNNNQKNIEYQRGPPNRRISQPDGKKQDPNKKRFNKSIDRVKVTNSNKSYKCNNKVVDAVHSDENEISQDKNIYDENQQKNMSFVNSEADCSDNATVAKISLELTDETELNKSNETTIFSQQHFNNEKSESKNVFNIPEIDDITFNPFATKSRICVTPPPNLELVDASNILNNMEMITESKNITNQLNSTVCIEDSVQSDVKVSSNTINTTSSSINTDKDVTVQEVNTEDEDTVEGPFFETHDLADVVKVLNIEGEKDTMQFEDLSTTSNNNDDVEKRELFIDAEAFEFLLNQNKSNVVADSGKESLFLKFDPLFAKRVSSESVLSAFASFQKRQSTPKKLPLINLAQDAPLVAIAEPSKVTANPEENNSETVSTKPMMIVNPAVAKQPVATPRISLTPKTNRQSLNFTSPAMVVIDRLLSLSGNTSSLEEGVSTAATSRNHDANIVLVQLRELLAEKELHVHSLKSESRELRERLTTLESQVKGLENEGEERLRKVNSLNECLAEKTKINKSMSVVVEEYERTIASLIAEMEQERKRNAAERIRLISERDEQTAHLASMEGSFSDLHSKYEKCKQVIMSMRANEDAYKKSLQKFDENLAKMQKNYDLLKQHATSKLNHANQELEKINRAHDADVVKLTAMIKRKDLHITSLEESLAQKNKATEELTAICDELISKVG